MAEETPSDGGTKIFGADTAATLMIPKGTADWEISDMFKRADYDNLLLMSFQLSDQETIDIRRCFDEVTHIFAFGRNVANTAFSVTFALFLYNKCTNEENEDKWLKLDTLQDKYEQARVFKHPKPLEITIDGFTINGFLVRLSVGDVNPATKVAAVRLTFIPDKGV